MIKILLADDHSLVRDGLRRIVEAAGDMEVIEEASDGREAIQKVRNAPPDVAVIDISMPGMDGLEVISQLHIYFPRTICRSRYWSGSHGICHQAIGA